jgi:hypothetical protein
MLKCVIFYLQLPHKIHVDRCSSLPFELPSLRYHPCSSHALSEPAQNIEVKIKERRSNWTKDRQTKAKLQAERMKQQEGQNTRKD